MSLILTHAQEQGMQFGTEHVYTYGPLGFLFFFLYSAENGGAQMLVGLLLCLAVAAGLCLLGRRLGPWWGLLAVGSFIWVASNNQPRTDLVLNAGLLCWGLLCFIECERRLTAAVAVFTALAVFGALAKNSFLFVGTLSVGLIGCDLWIRGRRGLGLGIVAGFGAGFLLGWTLAGQQWAHLPAFVLNAFTMVRGYDGALGWQGMRLAELAAWILGGLMVILVFARCLKAFPSDNHRRWRRMLLLIWIFGIAFAVWKHGVVRAFPCNIEMCFGWMAVLALALNVLQANSARPRRWVAGLAFVCWLLPIGTLQWLFFPAGMQSIIRPLEALYVNAGCVLDPAGYRYRLEMMLEANRRQAQLPRLRELVGEAPVDVFGRRQAYAMFNDLNYRPRPVPQSYAACNAELMRLNEQFFLSQKRPEFVLFELQPLERKFPPMEDARALRQLLINYEPVGVEAPFVLLKSKSADPAKLTLVQEGTVQAGQLIDLRPFNSTPLWIEIEIKPSWSGMLRQLLLRPSPVRLAARNSEGQLLTRGRAPATMLQAGFLASPLLLRTEDLLALYSQQPGVRPSGYAVELDPGHEGYWKKLIQFRIYRLENSLVQCASPEAAHFIDSLTSPGSSNGLAAKTPARPFNLFRFIRWHPTQPPPGNPQETLTFLLFLLLPIASGCGLVLLARRLKRDQAPPGWRALLLGNSLVLFCLLSTAIVAGEIYFRFFYDTTDSLGYTRVCERWVQRHWRVNQAGCRDNIEYQPAIAPGKRRITFVGDSFTAGHGIRNVNDRFPNRLRQANPDREIHVLANVGLDTGSELVLLNRAINKGYELDEVVLVYCLNDIGDLLPPEVVEASQSLARPGTGSWFVRNSYLVNFLFHRYQAARNPALKSYFPHLVGAYRGEVWERQKQRLKDLRDAVEARGGRLSVVTFPFLHALGPDYDYQFAHEKLNQLWRELSVPHVDLLSTYRDIPPSRLTVNPFDAHPNEYACKLAAEALQPFLSPAPRMETQTSKPQ